MKHPAATSLLPLLLLAAPPAIADPAPPAYRLDASLSAGYRLVDIDGSKDKYREDYNLRSGGRLFGLDLSGRASDQEATLLDRFHLVIDTPHDEPSSHFRLSASDTRRYDFRASWVRSKYFYEVPQLFERAVDGNVRLDDLHDFDTRRSDGAVDLRVRLGPAASLIAGYRLYERYGDGVSTVYAPGGDTFLVRAPIDSTTHVGRLGSEFAALGADVLVQQEFRHVGRDLDRDGPDGLGAAGLDPADGSTLARYDVHQDETIDAPTTTVRLRRPVGERGEITGAYLYQHARLSADRASLLDATRNLAGFPQTQRTRGAAEANVDTHVADMGATYRVSDRVQLNGSYRFDTQQQHGSLDETGTLGPVVTETRSRVRIHRVTGEVEVTPRDDLRLRAGVRWAQRDTDQSLATSDVGTDVIGAIADVRYRPWTRLDLFARYESAQIDDPYESAGAPLGVPPLPAREIALTFVNRGSAGLRLRPWDRVQVQYTFLADSRENDSFDARSEAYGNNVGVAFDPLPALSVYLGYTRRDVDAEADILVAPAYDSRVSVQSGSENVLTGQLAWTFSLLGRFWDTGGTLYYVESDQKLAPRLENDRIRRTFYDLDRIDGSVFLTLRHPWVEPSLEFRFVEYNERVLPRNDYRATMVTVKLTRRWGQ